MLELTAAVTAVLSRYPCEGRLWLGYSGGLDSTVLLHILTAQQIPLQLLHINHGLSPFAAMWQAHCVATAAALNIPIVVQQVKVSTAAGGLEQGARRARYAVFEQLLTPGDQMLLGHHGDDQAETLLLRLLRGAGNLGLAAMAETRPLGSGSLLRPLLAVSRRQLEEYARQLQLRWIEDDSNSDEALQRNYLRLRVMPLLSARWPLVERAARASANLRESAQLLQEVALEDLQRCDRRRARFGESIDIVALRELSSQRRNNLVRGWLSALCAATPEAPQLYQALQQGLNAAADSRLAVGLGGLVLRRFRARLYLTPPLPARREISEWCWDGVSVLNLPGGGQLYPSLEWPAGRYLVTLRKGGERAKPRCRQHSQTLKKLLQEMALEPWLRNWVPLIYGDGELLAVGDLFVCSKQLKEAPKWLFGSISD